MPDTPVELRDRGLRFKMGRISKSSNGQKQAKKLRRKLKKIWEDHGFGPDMPLAISKLSRELSERLNVEIVPGRKIAYSVLAHVGGENLTVHPPKAKKPRPQKIRTSAKPTPKSKADFYASWEWRTLRMKILKEFGAVCMCCGSTPKHTDMNGEPVKIVVDHIKPLHTHWDLRLSRDNLQVLCDECNQGKGAWDDTDYRPVKPLEDLAVGNDLMPVAMRHKPNPSLDRQVTFSRTVNEKVTSQIVTSVNLCF